MPFKGHHEKYCRSKRAHEREEAQMRRDENHDAASRTQNETQATKASSPSLQSRKQFNQTTLNAIESDEMEKGGSTVASNTDQAEQTNLESIGKIRRSGRTNNKIKIATTTGKPPTLLELEEIDTNEN